MDMEEMLADEQQKVNIDELLSRNMCVRPCFRATM